MHKKIYTLTKLLLFTAFFISFIPAHTQGVDEQYRQTIESADSYYKQSDYLNAKASYQVASQLKPDEQYPKDRLKESIRLLRIQMEEMAVFNEKVEYADQLYQEQSWDNAILAYEEASKLMPSQEYPGQQIVLIRNIIADETENEASYASLIRQGDDLFTTKDYAEAIKIYDQASAIYPGRPEVKEKINAGNTKLSEIAAQQSGYEKAISEAEMYHARKDYENELFAYQKAVELKPEDPMPQIKIRELNEFLRKYEAYNKFVSEGDELYISQQFANAKTKYEKALEILPGENYPREIISKINTALSEKTERDKAAYDEAIAQADNLYSQEDYQAAMIAYSDALRFWPDGGHAKQRLGSISEIMALKKAQEEAYANAITLADKLFANKEYITAKAEYRKAADINPFEQYPKVRIDEIDFILAEIQNKLDQYESVILGADKLFNVGDYAEARIQYLKAQGIFSERSYPEDQIKMIDNILGKEKATMEAYLAAIARGDEHFTNREWEDAKVDYVEANDLIPEEQYPKDKITEINNILAKLQADQETYRLALKTADQLFTDKQYTAALLEYRKAADIFREETYPRQQIEEIDRLLGEEQRLAQLEANYNEAIANAEAKFSEQDYAEARAAFELALTFKPDESYPGEKIAEIDDILSEQARLQGIEVSYSEAISAADGFFTGKQYAEARAEYTRASGLKPMEEYPLGKISEINAILTQITAQQATDNAYYTTILEADGLLAASDYLNAKSSYLEASEIKPGESYPKDKITEIDGILAEQARMAKLSEQYQIAIHTADAYYKELQYEEARGAYVRAQSIKADETYPAERIATIDNILANLEAQRLIDEGYANAIALGDNHLANKEYGEAKAEYRKAVEFKANERYPIDKIAEIDGILAEQARLQEIEEMYITAIANADGFFNNEQYTEASTAYQEALAVKPEDVYALGKVSEIDGILGELTRLQEIEDSYNNAISTADAAFNAGNYQSAQDAYTTALAIKPQEQYPADKIKEIEGLLNEQARLLSIETQYNKAVSAADSLFNLKDYDGALTGYNQALEIKAGESYPQQKIDDINSILEEIARQKTIDENYAQAISNADESLDRNAYLEALLEYEKAAGIKPEETYPKEKIAEINSKLSELETEKEKAYNTAIAQADSYYDMGNYRNAKGAYQTAVNIKPDESYARERLDEVSVLYMAELESLKVEYRKVVAEADNYFRGKIYDGAIENYRIAADILPDETYPGKMISRITKIINDNAITDVNKLAQIIPNNTDRRFSFSSIPANVRKENYILIKARNVSDHDFKMFVNFGKDNSKNGGVVLQVPKGEITRDYIIRIGALYKWFSEDNNWLGIYPEGGDIEVALIRISKSD
ncbi:MAG: hypothetical protein KAT76_02600 [Bacteroidales bacterium]|nr:hypothetical protein [Bacteroidales bacterium]